jgi:hypothetical protein
MFPQSEDFPEGPAGFRKLGHREYVGGWWDYMQQLQYNFMRAQGLKPHHHLWDIGCGSLRAGVALIRYLDRGHYHGVDRWKWLVDQGIKKELGYAAYKAKYPELIVSGTFDFAGFTNPPDYVLAQSLFTHLPKNDIIRCLQRVRSRSLDSTIWFASFLVADAPVNNPNKPHDQNGFFYTVQEMEGFARETGWNPAFIGEWDHPYREQQMMRFDPALIECRTKPGDLPVQAPTKIELVRQANGR